MKIEDEQQKQHKQFIKAKQRKQNEVIGYKGYVEEKQEDEDEYARIENEFDEQRESERTKNLKASAIASDIFAIYLKDKSYEARKNIITEIEMLHLKKKCEYDNRINTLVSELLATKNRKRKKDIEEQIRKVNKEFNENAGIVRTYLTQAGKHNAYINIDYPNLKDYILLLNKAKKKGVELAFGSHKLASNLQKHGAGFSNIKDTRNRNKKRLSNKIYGWLNPEIKKKHKKKNK